MGSRENAEQESTSSSSIQLRASLLQVFCLWVSGKNGKIVVTIIFFSSVDNCNIGNFNHPLCCCWNVIFSKQRIFTNSYILCFSISQYKRTEKRFCMLLGEQTLVLALTLCKAPSRPRGSWLTLIISSQLKQSGGAWPAGKNEKRKWAELIFLEYLYLNTGIFFIHCGWTFYSLWQ